MKWPKAQQQIYNTRAETEKKMRSYKQFFTETHTVLNKTLQIQSILFICVTSESEKRYYVIKCNSLYYSATLLQCGSSFLLNWAALSMFSLKVLSLSITSFGCLHRNEFTTWNESMQCMFKGREEKDGVIKPVLYMCDQYGSNMMQAVRHLQSFIRSPWRLYKPTLLTLSAISYSCQGHISVFSNPYSINSHTSII